MKTPYHHFSESARKEVVRRKAFHEQKLKECEQLLHALDALPSFLEQDPLHESPPVDRTKEQTDDAQQEVSRGNATPPGGRRRKEDLYDEEMIGLLSQVKVASKMATYQHFHRALRGNTSIGAVESYLKRAVLRGVIVRVRRGEYALPATQD